MGRSKVKDLKKFLEENGVKNKFHEFSESTLTVEHSSERLGVDPEIIVKSLVFKDGDGNPLLAVVSGENRADEDKLSEVHGSEVKIAKAREVEDFTGYKIGEVPPLIPNLKTYLDSEIFDFDRVIAGGGSTHTLVELNPKDILRLADAEIAEIS